jgi:hypothetical protein
MSGFQVLKLKDKKGKQKSTDTEKHYLSIWGKDQEMRLKTEKRDELFIPNVSSMLSFHLSSTFILWEKKYWSEALAGKPDKL